MRRALLLIIIAACGGDDDSSNPRRDAATTNPDGRLIDASVNDGMMIDMGVVIPDAPTAVRIVTCTGTPPEIRTNANGNAYEPPTQTIGQNGIVKFTMPVAHNVVPDSGVDTGLSVPFNTTRCLEFTTTGTFGFHCGPHGFMGSVTVN